MNEDFEFTIRDAYEYEDPREEMLAEMWADMNAYDEPDYDYDFESMTLEEMYEQDY